MSYQQPCEALSHTLVMTIARASGWLKEYVQCFEGLKNVKTSDSAPLECNSESRFQEVLVLKSMSDGGVLVHAEKKQSYIEICKIQHS